MCFAHACTCGLLVQAPNAAGGRRMLQAPALAGLVAAGQLLAGFAASGISGVSAVGSELSAIATAATPQLMAVVADMGHMHSGGAHSLC